MPKITPAEESALARLSNKIFDVLQNELELSEARAAEAAEKAIAVLRRAAEGKS